MSKYESTSVLCTVYNVLCCQAVIRNLVYRFLCRLQASNNSLVMSIQSSSLVQYIRLESGSTGDVYCMCMVDLHTHAISVFRAGFFFIYGSLYCMCLLYQSIILFYLQTQLYHNKALSRFCGSG